MINEDDNYLFDFLDQDIAEAKGGIKAGNGLTQKGATAMLLKGMYNHIAHLDLELSDIRKIMVTKDEFNFLKWTIMFGFVFIAVLQSYLAIFVK